MILDTKVSIFESTSKTDSKNTISIRDVLERFKTGFYKEDVLKVRAGNSLIKKQLNTIAFHGIFDQFRKKDCFIEASGLIILDIDDVDVEDIEESKRDIIESDNSVLCAMTSPSGNGIKVLYYVEPDLINADNYRQIGKQLIENFEVYGDVDYLSVTDCLISTYDPNILINEKAEPAFIFIKDTIKIKGELEELDTTKTLWDNVEDFFDTVLADEIAEKTNSNFHYIQVAILDLAKFGFYYPKEDLSFVIDYAETEFGHSPRNKNRFLEVAELAKNYPQLKHPYKTIVDEGEDDEEIDFSKFKDKPKSKVKNEGAKDASKEIEGDGFVDYTTFFNKVLEVAKEGDRVGFEISFKNFADIFRFRGSGVLTFTGIPSHGKTEFVDACILDLARMYKQCTIICGFEQSPEEHIIKLMRKMVGTNVTCPSWLNEENMPLFHKAYDFTTNFIKHIDTTKLGGNINTLLSTVATKIELMRKSGKDVKYVVLDPFNMLSIKGKYSGHEKIEEILRRITLFSHQMDVLVILIAHPFKMKKNDETGKYEVPDFYSVKGSSAFFEMSYHGLVIYRTGYEPEDPVFVRVLKVKQNNLGAQGEDAYFRYDRNSGRYIPTDKEGNDLEGDHYDKDWLKKTNY